MKQVTKKNAIGYRCCEMACDIYIGLLFSVFVLFWAPYGSITAAKYLLFRILSGGFVVLTSVLILELFVIRRITMAELRQAASKKEVLLGLATVYAGCVCLSAVVSPYSYNVWDGMSRNDGLITNLIYVASFCLIALFGRLKRWHITALGGAMLIFCGICLLQLMGLNPLNLYPDGCNYYDAYVKYSGEFLGTVGNAGLVAALLVMAFGLFFGLMITERGKRRAWVALPMLTTLAVILFSKIAAGYVAVAATVMVVTPISLWYKKSKHFKKALIMESVIGLSFLIFVWLCDFGGNGTLYELHEVLHLNLQDSFGSSRIKIWRQVLSEMPQHFLLGTGPDSMEAWDMEGFSKFVPSAGVTVQHGIDAAHNEYLNIAAQQGMLAFLVYAALIAIVLKRFLQGKKNPYAIAVFSAAFAYAVQALFGIAMCMVTPLFWTFLGLLVQQTTLSESEAI